MENIDVPQPKKLPGRTVKDACAAASISVERIDALIEMLRDERIEPGILADTVELSPDQFVKK